MSRTTWLTIIKLVIMVGAYSYLAWLLLTFDHYSEIASTFRDADTNRLLILAYAVALMPVNWLIEAVKWRCATRHVEQMSLKQSYSSVISGLASGFFTPNRVGEFVGRVLSFKDENRPEGVLLVAACSMAQTFATVVCGLIAAICLIDSTLWIAVSAIIVASIIYATLPLYCRWIESHIRWQPVEKAFSAIASLSAQQMSEVTILSLIRFAIYSFQYFLVMRFFGIDIAANEAIKLIPLNYLLITCTPSIAFSEAGIRGTYAAMLIGQIGLNSVAGALAGVTIWGINYVVPMLAGTIIVARVKE